MDYTKVPSDEVIERTVAALTAHNFEPIVVATRQEALDKIKGLIPAGASVMNGTSRTLQDIGYIDYLKEGAHGWNNLHAGIVAEKDPAKQAALRKQALISDYYLGSVHALSETGEAVIASNTGSQLPHIAYSSQNIIFVIGAQKIAPTLEDARKRLVEHVIPLENERMKGVYGYGTYFAKELIFHGENPAMGRKVRMIIVKEALGF